MPLYTVNDREIEVEATPLDAATAGETGRALTALEPSAADLALIAAADRAAKTSTALRASRGDLFLKRARSVAGAPDRAPGRFELVYDSGGGDLIVRAYVADAPLVDAENLTVGVPPERA